MGGDDGFANAAYQFNMASFGSNRRAQRAFVQKLENELGYQDLTDANGRGTGSQWTQAKANQNIDILSYGLKQLDSQGLLNDGKMSTLDIRKLDLDAFLKSPALQDSIRTDRNPSRLSPQPAAKNPDNPRVTAVPEMQTQRIQSTGGGDYGNRPMDKEIKIHTLNSSTVGRQGFGNNDRWYEESGNTQNFRLYIINEVETGARRSLLRFVVTTSKILNLHC